MSRRPLVGAEEAGDAITAESDASATQRGAGMKCRLLGPLEVEADGQLVELGGSRQGVLVAVLLLQANQVVASDRLIEELWGDHPPAQATNVLQSHVSRLRRILEPGRPRGGAWRVLVTRGRGYALLVAPEQVDSLRFERLVDEGRRALDEDPDLAAATLRDALGLWRGEVLADVRDRLREQGEIVRLETLKRAALGARIKADLALGRHAEVVGELESLVGEEPLDEQLCQYLMLALYRCGRLAAAIDVYWAAHELLDDQYGVTPGKELAQLHRAIKLRDPSLDWVPPASPEHARSTDARPSSASQPAAPPVQGASRVGFVGREAEFGRLRAALADARAGQGRLVLVGGEMGIGKSRIAYELADEAQAVGMEVLWGWMWEADGAPTFWPWVLIMRSWMATRAPERLRQVLGSDAAVIAQLLPEVAERLPGLPDPPSLKPAEARFRLFDAVTRVLKRVASMRPLVLVLDDLHRADVPSLLLLQFLARELGDAHILVVGTFRDTKADQDQLFVGVLAELGREPVTRRMELEGLSEDHVARFVELATGIEASPVLVAKLHERTSGNPLFLSQLVLPLAEEGDLDRFEEELDERVPQEVLEAVQWRLGQLPEAARTVLMRASVMGRRFYLDVLATVSGLDEGRLLELIEQAAALGFVREEPRTANRYRFSHILVRDALYRQLSGPRRALLHQRIGETLEERYADDLKPRLAPLAHHFLQAGDRAKALGYLSRAGEQAMAQLAYEEAARLFELALDQSPDEARRCGLLLALADAQMKAGDTVSARDTYLRAADSARVLRAPEQLALAALGFGEFFLRFAFGFAGSRQRMMLVELLEEALGTLDASDSALRARVLGHLAIALHWQPDGERWRASRERRLTLSQEAVAMARRLDNPGVLASVLDTRCSTLLSPDTLQERLGLAAEIRALAETAGDREMAQAARRWHIVGFLELGNVLAMDAELAAYARVAEELRQPLYLYWAHVWRGTRALIAGRFDEAERHNLQARGLGQRLKGLNSTELLMGVGSQLLLIRREQGRLAELEEMIEGFAREFPEILGWQVSLGLLHAATGEEEAARGVFEQLAAKDFTLIPRYSGWLVFMAAAAEVCAFLGDARRAATLYELLVPYERRCVAISLAFGCLGSAAHFLGQLAVTRGHVEAACRHFEVALEVNERMGAKPFLAHTTYHYARALLSRNLPGDRQRAHVLLDEALQTARELGMASLIKQLLA